MNGSSEVNVVDNGWRRPAPSLSLPSMLVLRSIMGTKKTAVYVAQVVVMATFTGMLYGAMFPN